MRIQRMDSEFLDGSPARVSRAAGTVQLAPSYYRHTEDGQRFILAHEFGHYALDTSDQHWADLWAAGYLMRRIGLKRTFRAMNNALKDSEANDRRRIALFNALAEYDNKTNGNNMNTISGEWIFNTDTGEMQPCENRQCKGADGFVYANNYFPADDTAPVAPVEAEEFVKWCGFHGYPVAVAHLRAYRGAKREAWDNAEDMPSVSPGTSGGKFRTIEDELSEIEKEVVKPTAAEPSPTGKQQSGGWVWFLVAAAAVAAIILIIKD